MIKKVAKNTVNRFRNEEAYRNIIKNNIAGYYCMNKKGIIVDANDSFARTLGFSSHSKIIGKAVNKIYKGSSDSGTFLRNITLRKKLINHESHIVLLNGKHRYYIENTSFFKDPETKEEFIEAIIFDITELKEKQIALHEREERYKNLFEQNMAGVFRTDTNGKIYDCNQAFIDIFGYKNKQELLKKSSHDLYFSKQEREKYITQLRKKGSVKNYELLNKKKDGSKIWILANVELFKEGKSEIVQGTLIDISEKKRAEEQLLKQADKYRKLFENASDAILIVKDWTIVDCNSITTQLFKTSKKNVIGKKFADFIAVDRLSKEQKNTYKTVFINKKPLANTVCECVLKDSRKDYKYVNVAISVLSENNEELYQLILHDNTKQVNEQRELETSKNNFENLIEHSPDGNVLIHNDRVIFTNKATVQIFGLRSRKEILNKNIISFFVKTHQPEILKLIKFVRENKTNTRFYEYQVKSKEKKRIDIGIQLTSVKYGELDCVNMIIYDLELKKQLAQQELRANIAEETNKELARVIKEHKETQEKLSDQIAMTQAVLEGSQNVLIYTLNRQHQITSYNSIFERTAKQVFGVQLQRNDNFAKFLERAITSEDRQIMYERFNKAFKGESVRLEGPLKIKHGGEVWIETFINPIKRNNKVVEISCISTDITEKKMKSEELKQSLKEKEVLLKEVHHRVKNNLQIISSILNLQTSFNNDPKVNEILKESQNRVKSMAYLHESLYQNKNFSFINFSDYLINLSKNLVHSYYLSDSLVDLKLEVDDVQLNLDQAIPCGLMVNELLTNAIKYAFPEKRSDARITIRVSEKNGKVEITVGDNGVGLPKGFDVNKTNSLGLQLVSTLTEQLDGKLSVNNDKGAKIVITFKKQ